MRFSRIFAGVPDVESSRRCVLETAAWIDVSPAIDPSANCAHRLMILGLMETYSDGETAIRGCEDFGSSAK